MASLEDKFVRILETDEWVVDYDREKKKYRVSYFEEFHFCDEIWFDAYEDKEVDDKIERIIIELVRVKGKFIKNFSSRRYLSKSGIEHLFDEIIKMIQKYKAV